MFLYEGLVLKVRENGIISETQRYIHTVMHGPQTKEQLYICYSLCLQYTKLTRQLKRKQLKESTNTVQIQH